MTALTLLLSLTLQQPDSVSADPEVVLEAACDTAPRILSGPLLIYPLDLLRSGKQGLVVVQFVLDTTGRAERNTLRVISTPHMGFNVAAKDYVQNAQFTPGIFRGRKVRTLVQFPVVFRVKDGRR